MKLKYIILFFGLPHYIPQTVSGRTGKFFGHAQYDVNFKAHTFTFDQETWTKHGLDVFNWLRRRHTVRCMLHAQIVPDPNAPETHMAEEIDRLRAELTQATAALESKTKEATLLLNRVMALEGDAVAQTVEPPIMVTIEGITAPIDAPKDTSETTGPTLEDGAAFDETARLEKLKGMPYRALRDIAKALNEAALAADPTKPRPISFTPPPDQAALALAISKLPESAALLAAAE